MAESFVNSALFMDRADALGNTLDEYGRRALHALISGRILIKGASTAGRVTKQNLTQSAWTACPATPLAGRNTVLIQNQSTTLSIILNYDPAAPASTGIIVGPGAAKEIMLADNVILYGRSNGPGATPVAVEELA